MPMNTGNAAPAPVPSQNQPQSQQPGMGASMDNDSQEKGSNNDGSNMEIWSSAKANRRTKERKISFVIEKVSMWRKLYNGIQDSQNKIVRYR